MIALTTPTSLPGPNLLEKFLHHPGIFTINTLLTGGRALRYQAYKHPWITRTICLLILIVCADLVGAQAAFADDNSMASAPGLANFDLKDSHQIPVYQYMQLPLDRGDVWTYQKTLISYPLDLLWAGHLFYVTLTLATVNYLLSFAWVGILTAPLNDIAVSLQSLLSSFHWIAFALLISAFVTGIVMLRGKFASSMIELGLAIILALLATGILSNPVATITGPDGAISKAQMWGGQIAIAITSKPEQLPENVDPTKKIRTTAPASSYDAKSILTDTISAELTDIFVRTPAQIVTFGKVLDTKCGAIFDDEMKKKKAVGADNSVRDRVGDCDPQAKFYVQNPNFNQLLSATTVAVGSGSLNSFALCLAFFFVYSVLMTVWSGFKLMIQTLVGILPYIARTGFWYGLAGIFSSVIMLIFAEVFLAGYLKLVTVVLEGTAALGLIMQMLILNMLLLAGIIILIVFHHKAKKAGESLGGLLNRIGKSGERKEKSHPVQDFTKRAAPRLVPVAAEALLRHQRNPSWHPQQRQQPVAGSSTLTDLGEQRTSTTPPVPALTSPPRLALPAGGTGNSGTSGPPQPTPPNAPTPPRTPRPPASQPTNGPAPQPNKATPQAKRAKRSKAAAAGFNIASTAASFIPGGAGVVAGVKIAAKVGSQAAANKAQRDHQNASQTPRIHVDPRGVGTVQRPLVGRVVYVPTPKKTQSMKAIQLAAKLAKMRAAAK